MWTHNPFRLFQVMTEEKVKRGLDALVSYRSKDVLVTVALLWCGFLVMLFTLLVTVRLALNLPLYG
jgi:hypothetical protein